MAIHLRYLQTLTEIAAEKNSTIIFPVPIDWMQAAHGQGQVREQVSLHRHRRSTATTRATISRSRGEIETSSVPELLRSILASARRASSPFRSGDVEQERLPRPGASSSIATSNDPDERLGESLLLRGKITARQYVEASKQIRPGRRLGAILVEMEAIESEELLPAVEQQVKEICSSIC